MGQWGGFGSQIFIKLTEASPRSANQDNSNGLTPSNGRTTVPEFPSGQPMPLELTPVEVLPRLEADEARAFNYSFVGFMLMDNDLLEAVIISNSGSSRSPEKKARSILKAVAVALRHYSMDSKYNESPLRAACWMVAQYIEAQVAAGTHEYH